MGAMKVSTLFSRRRAGLAAAACVLAASGGAATVAHAQEPGVVYEPGSPSAKEYAIPLEEARTDAGGAIPGSAETRAFGIGISRRGGGGRGPGAGGAAAGAVNAKGSRGGARKGGARTDGGSGVEPRGLRERLAEAEAASAPALWKLAPLLLVLLPGLIVGLLLARRGGPPPHPAT